MLITDKAPSASVKAMVDFLKASGQECSIIPGPEMTAICPDVQFGPETEGIFIKESSCYRSDKMIQILQVGRSMLNFDTCGVSEKEKKIYWKPGRDKY